MIHTTAEHPLPICFDPYTQRMAMADTTDGRDAETYLFEAFSPRPSGATRPKSSRFNPPPSRVMYLGVFSEMRALMVDDYYYC